MADQTLIDRLRRMTGVDPAQATVNGVAHWTDSELDELLEGRVSARFIQDPVTLYPTVDATGHIVFLDGRVPVPGVLDVASVVLVTFAGAPITGATTTDDGRITFAESMLGAGPLLSGIAYDLNGAAADLLTEWAAAVKLGYDVKTDGQEMSRSQRHAQLLAQAAAYRAQALPGTVGLSNPARRGPAGSLARRALQTFRWLGH